jgi:hypothetical protein
MQRRTLGFLTGAMLVAVATIAALAVGPANLLSLSGPGTRPNAPGTGGDGGAPPHAFAIEKPTWHTGDSWTYSANASADGGPGSAIATGTLTRTVVSMDASTVNVSVEGSFRSHWSLAPTDPQAAGSIMLNYAIGFRDATIGGYTWYRASDLATVKEVRTITFKGTFGTETDVYNATYTASVETTFDPALDVWSFPLESNSSWTATSNASVHAVARWSIDAGAQPWVFSKDVNFTRVVRLSLISGASEDVVTPAGTFPSIPIWTGSPHVGALATSRDPGLADGLEEDAPIPRDHVAAAWFSETAKNVVMLTYDTGDAHLNLSLTDYHLG